MSDDGSVRRMLFRLVASLALLGVGFAAVLAAYYAYARASGLVAADRADVLRFGLGFYFRIVFLKGLLPQLVLAFALRELAASRAASGGRGLFASGLAAAVAYAVVAPLLLTVPFDAWPALQLREPMHHVKTAALMIGAVAAALWLPTLRRSR